MKLLISTRDAPSGPIWTLSSPRPLSKLKVFGGSEGQSVDEKSSAKALRVEDLAESLHLRVLNLWKRCTWYHPHTGVGKTTWLTIRIRCSGFLNFCGKDSEGHKAKHAQEVHQVDLGNLKFVVWRLKPAKAQRLANHRREPRLEISGRSSLNGQARHCTAGVSKLLRSTWNIMWKSADLIFHAELESFEYV